MSRFKNITTLFFSNVGFRAMIATGLSARGSPVAGLRVAAAPGLQPSAAEAGAPPEPQGRWSRRGPRDAPGARAVRPGARHVTLSVPGSKMRTARGPGACRGPPHPCGHRPAPTPASARENEPGAGRALRTPTCPGASRRGRTDLGWLPPAVSAQRARHRKKGIPGRPPAAFVHSHPPACPAPPFPAARGRSPGQPGLSTGSPAPWAQGGRHLQGPGCPDSCARPASGRARAPPPHSRLAEAVRGACPALKPGPVGHSRGWDRLNS